MNANFLFSYLCRCIPMFPICFVYLYPGHYTSLSLSPSFLSLDCIWKREKEPLTSGLLWVSLYWMFLKQRFQFSESGSSAEVFPNLAPSGLWNLLSRWQWFRSIGVGFWKQHSKMKNLSCFTLLQQQQICRKRKGRRAWEGTNNISASHTSTKWCYFIKGSVHSPLHWRLGST